MTYKARIKRLKRSLRCLRRNYFGWGFDLITNLTVASIYDEIQELKDLGYCTDTLGLPAGALCACKTHKEAWKRLVKDIELKDENGDVLED